MKTLGELCNIVSGGTPLRSKTEFWDGGTIPWIKISNIKEKYVSEADEFITEEGLLGSSAKMLNKGTVLYTIFATLGEVGILKINACTNQAIAGLTIKDPTKLSTDYLYYYLKSKKSYVNSIGRGVAQNNINMTLLKKFVIPLPNLLKQNEIVGVLDNVSNIIDIHQKELKYLDELVKARFVEMFGGMDYPSIPLIDTVKKGAGLSYGIVVSGENVEDGIPMIRPSDFKNGKLDLLNVYRVAADIEEKYTKTRLIGDEILVQVIGQPGQVMLATNECRGMNVTRNLAVIRPNHEIINRIYLKEFIEKEDSQQILLKNTKQSTLKQLPLNLLKQLEVQVPPMKLQNQFADFVREVDKSREIIQKKIVTYQELFDKLMQEYFG